MGALARNGLIVTLVGIAATGCGLIDLERDGDDQGEDCDDDHQGDQDGDGEGCDGDDDGGGSGSDTFMVIAMDPQPDSNSATPLSTITLTFNDTVDLASATDTTVWIRHRDSRRRVPATISGGASADELVLTPVLPLDAANLYTVDVDGVQNPDGLTATYEGRFWVKIHIREDFQRYQAGGLHSYYNSTWDDASGLRAVHWMLAGGDNLAGTDDDRQRDLSEYFYDDWQDPVYMLNRLSPGDDGDYYTGDDVMRVERHIEWDGVGQQRLHHTDPGGDNLFGTDDDFDYDANRRFYDPDTDELLGLCDVDVGGDDTAFTGDDAITGCRRYVELPGERRTLESVAPGADGDWLTGDDELGETYARALEDADGAVVRRETHALAGDGTDTPSAATLIDYTELDRDADHLLIEMRTYLADGTGVERSVFTNDAGGFRREELVYHPGGDGDLLSPDDVLFSRMAWFFFM